jgi:hypothetical protein
MAPKDYHQTPLFHVRVAQETIDDIKRLAQDQGVTNGDIIAQAIECLKAKRSEGNANL